MPLYEREERERETKTERKTERKEEGEGERERETERMRVVRLDRFKCPHANTGATPDNKRFQRFVKYWMIKQSTAALRNTYILRSDDSKYVLL